MKHDRQRRRPAPSRQRSGSRRRAGVAPRARPALTRAPHGMSCARQPIAASWPARPAGPPARLGSFTVSCQLGPATRPHHDLRGRPGEVDLLDPRLERDCRAAQRPSSETDRLRPHGELAGRPAGGRADLGWPSIAQAKRPSAVVASAAHARAVGRSPACRRSDCCRRRSGRRTRSAAGSRSPAGLPTCTMPPWFITQIRSAMVIASSWSCVTNRKVIADLALQALEEALHLPAQLGVERAQRLVEQDQPRLADDRARQRHPLALAAAELGGIARAEIGRAPPAPSASSTRVAALGAWRRRAPEAVADVLRHGHVRKQRVVLEDRVERAAG